MIVLQFGNVRIKLFQALFVLATVTFVVLKILGVICWSWWWVFAPIWVPIAVYYLIIFIINFVRGEG